MKRILGVEIGNCIHVAGVLNFLELGKQLGCDIKFLGSAVSVGQLIQGIKREKPDIVAIGYRLSAQSCKKLLLELKKSLSRENLLDRDYLFGGTTSTCRVAEKIGIFKRVFDGTELRDEVISFLRGMSCKEKKKIRFPDSLVERIKFRQPYPLIRHHIGLSTVGATVKAIKEIAQTGVLDIVSIAPDQTAQESFFRPGEQKSKTKGAGGVPVRSEKDFAKIYEATRCGNYPLCRCYSGTNDVLKWAKMLVKAIKNAWCAVPLFWYNRMDKRGPRTLIQSIQEAQQLMQWHGERDIPVEVNDSHQWSLRYAPDSIAVATAFLAAFNAKKMGVKYYVSQYMLNTPPQISPTMDLAKMLAKIEMIESLHSNIFTSYRQIRPGLLSFPVDLEVAKAQLVFSVTLGLMLNPQIIHVVAYSESQYEAKAKEIIESVMMVNHIIEEYYRGFPSALLADRYVRSQKEKLKYEAWVILEAVKKIGGGKDDSLTRPEVLTKAVEMGILDAPQLQGSEVAKGNIATAIIDGACVTIDPRTKKPLSEKQRIKRILDKT